MPTADDIDASNGSFASKTGVRANERFTIAVVRTLDDVAATARLFQAYAESLDIDLAYQDFEAELASLPGAYAPPAGTLLLARDRDGQPVGCVGLRPNVVDRCCEMKRLSVAPAGRGAGLGRQLVASVLQVAADIGNREVLLDTLPDMVAATSLYRQCGFEPIPAYYDSPVSGTIFMRCILAPPKIA